MYVILFRIKPRGAWYVFDRPFSDPNAAGVYAAARPWATYAVRFVELPA